MVAFHFPPIAESSGVHRTLKFSQYLSELGWRPLVLTIDPRAYRNIRDSQIGDIGSKVLVRRAFGLDASRQLAIAGRYPGFLALPDRWISWWFGGVFSGLKLVRRFKPKVIFSTFPITTAQLIGYTLHRLTGIPWVADLRDSMTEPGYPSGKLQWRIWRWIEGKVVKHAVKVIFTSPGTLEMYRQRYPQLSSDKWVVIENGFDEEAFSRVVGLPSASKASSGKHSFGCLKLLHSGIVYPAERNPNALFEAIAELKNEGLISSQRLNVILRATNSDDLYRPQLRQLGIDDIVLLKPGIGYVQALEEMMSVDGLLILQGNRCNHQVPAKLYEYFRAGRPIIALTESGSDTAEILRSAGVNSIAPLDDKHAIKSLLQDFLEGKVAQQGIGSLDVGRYSRKYRAKELVDVLNSVVGLKNAD